MVCPVHDEPAPLHRTLQIGEGGSALDVLGAHTGLSRSKIKDAMSKGAVWLRRGGNASRVRRASTRVGRGDELAIYYNPAILASDPPEPECLVDRARYSVWYKPAGMMSSGSRFGDHHSIVRWVERTWDRPSFIVHRLDRFTRGIMLIAHGKRAADHLARQFRERTTRKVYQALVQGEMHHALTLQGPLDGRHAVTHVRPEAISGGTTQISVRIETGRKHQIRRHLADAGYPLVGDVQHGAATHPDLQLVAVALGFDCPVAHQQVQYVLSDELCLFPPQRSLLDL